MTQQKTFQIRGVKITLEDFTDRDLTDLAFVADYNAANRLERERAGCDAFKCMFPDAPSEWTRDGRLRLHSFELLEILNYMNTTLENDSRYQEFAKKVEEPVSQTGSNGFKQRTPERPYKKGYKR